jgi:hypothetical protein
MDQRLGTRTLAFLTVLVLLTGFAYFFHSGASYDPDSPTYIVPAANLLTHHAFLDANGNPETVRTPGYPLLIVPFLWANLDLRFLVILQHLLRVGVILGTTAFAFSLSHSYRQAVLTAVLLCIDLPLLDSANAVLTEMLFTVVLGVGVWLLWKEGSGIERPWPLSLLYGLLLGASVLIRPVSLYFFIPAGVYLLLVRTRHRWRTALSFVLAFAVLPLLWAERNYRRTGYFTVSTIAGYNMLLYRAAGALAIEDPGRFSANLDARDEELKAEACADLTRIYHHDCGQLPFPVVADYYSRLGHSILLSHPLAYLKLAALGTAAMMLGGGAAALAEITGLNPRVGIPFLLIYTVPAFCFAVIGLVKLGKEQQTRRFFYLALLTILYFIVVSAGAEAYSRLRVPIIPIYVVLTAAGIDAMLGRFLPRAQTQQTP